MEPFHVICETCRARLKIRSERVVGEIHACPKCESMVHIVPPAGWMPAAGPVAAAATPIDVTIPAELPSSAGSSLIVWAVSGVALVAVVAAAALFWPRGRGPEPPAAAAVATADPQSSPSDEQPSAESPGGSAEIASPQVEEVAQLAPAAEPAPDHAALSPPTTEASADDLGAVAAVTPPPNETAAAPATSESRTDKPVLKFDPLDFDPAELSLGGATRPPQETSGSVADATAAPPIIAESKEEEPAGGEPAAAADDPSVTVRIGPDATDARRVRNVAEQMALKIDSLDLAAVPLVRFVDVVSQLSDVPITIDPDALAMVGVSAQSTVTARTNAAALDSILRDGLKLLRLDVEEHGGQLVVVGLNADKRRSVDYDVADLMPRGAADAAELSAMIQHFVAPDSWRDGPEGGTIRVDGSKLHVEQTGDVHVRILMFCERLRLARGLPQRSRYPAQRLTVDSPHAKLSEALRKPTTFTLLPWTRLDDVVRHWQESLGVTMLVDWRALASEELAPGTPVACSAINQPWGEALDAVLEPLGLAWWAVDGETIQITSRSALARIERIEFYPAPKGQAEGDVAAMEGATHAELDAASGRMIVLATPEVHRSLSNKLSGTAKQ